MWCTHTGCLRKAGCDQCGGRWSLLASIAWSFSSFRYACLRWTVRHVSELLLLTLDSLAFVFFAICTTVATCTCAPQRQAMLKLHTQTSALQTATASVFADCVSAIALMFCLPRHHMLHHYRNEDYWLSFTAPAVDAWFGTLPSSASSVPLTAMARKGHSATAGAGSSSSSRSGLASVAAAAGPALDAREEAVAVTAGAAAARR
jgi:sterol desaturase/sphingolipid hydroxylase (fatty acid hydroxylase superfamily)